MEHKIDLENEIWKVWKDTSYSPAGHLYEVSNQGRARKDGELVDFSYQGDGYYMFGGDYLHRIMAKLFIPNPENKLYVDHINTDIHDNRVCNLRWVTASENISNPITKSKRIGSKRDEKSKHNMTIGQMGNTNVRDHIWINLDNKLKRVHKDKLNEWLENGWEIGRNIKTKWVHNNNERHLVCLDEIQYWLENGWELGKGKLKKNKSAN